MHTIFYGWRRKAGVVTLVLALAFAAWWVRSLVVGDILWIRVGNRMHQFITANGKLYWWGYQEPIRPNLTRWDSSTFYEPVQGIRAIHHESLFRRKLTSSRFAEWIISHWSIVTPLTLLSAYLLLWRPRKQGSFN